MINHVKVSSFSYLCSSNFILDKFALTDIQVNLLRAFMDGKDAIGVLPTSYGKSIIYFLAPVVSFQLHSSGHANYHPEAIIIVVTPTISLIDDQVKRCTELGIKAIQLSKVTDFGNIKESIIFSTPESLLAGKLRKPLRSDSVKERLLGMVIDEAHLVVKW